MPFILDVNPNPAIENATYTSSLSSKYLMRARRETISGRRWLGLSVSQNDLRMVRFESGRSVNEAAGSQRKSRRSKPWKEGSVPRARMISPGSCRDSYVGLQKYLNRMSEINLLVGRRSGEGSDKNNTYETIRRSFNAEMASKIFSTTLLLPATLLLFWA